MRGAGDAGAGVYEFIILQRLMHRPMHGYLIAKIIGDIIGPFAKLSHGRLYPLLAKLEADGLIAAEDARPGRGADRRQRTYRITEAGRRRFRQLLLDITANPGDYAERFWLKVPSFDALAPAERLYLIDHYLTYCQTHLFHLRGEMDDLAEQNARSSYLSPEELDATLYTMRHYLRRWQLEQEQALDLRAREVARLEGTPSAAAPPREA
jgi:DNA-binding PadR family transcriptional regulator